jgi:Tol biopolymer transport system component/DNA-binding winged helix-turn-helix (wHTH) protein
MRLFYEFDNFRFDPETRSLWCEGELISVFPKSLEILAVLVAKHGEIVSREELLETVWPGTFVEESNITYAVSLLRKALGERDKKRFIQTIPKRGYRFVAETREIVETGGNNVKTISRGDHPLAVASLALPGIETSTARVLSFGAPARALAEKAPAPDSADLNGPRLQVIPSTKPQRSRRLITWLGAVAVVMIVLGFSGFLIWTQRGDTRSPATVEDVNFKKLTFTGDVTFPVLAPDGASFAFVRDGALFIQNVESGEEMRLNVEGEKTFGILQFSPDGRSIYYRNRVGFDLPGSVFQVSRFGGMPKLIAENVWSGFGFSPDGKQMAFVRESPNKAESALIIKNPETGTEEKLAAVTAPSTFLDNGYPAWSPDGKKIAAVVFKNAPSAPVAGLVVVDAETGAIETIKVPQLVQFEQPVWLPDGREIMISARENGKFFQLWRVSYPDGQLGKITNDLSAYRGVSVSADGKKLLARQFTLYSHLWTAERDDLENLQQKTFGNLSRDGVGGLDWTPGGDIVYVTQIIGDNDLWVYRPADDSRQQVTKNAGEVNRRPAASGDGRYIYFESNRTGAFHIWRMDATGANQTQVTFGDKEIDLFPQISSDGAWLYYVQRGPAAAVLRRKSLTTTDQPEALTEAGKSSPDSFLSLSPDGKFLAFHDPTEKVGAEDAKRIYRIAVVSTDHSAAPRFLSIAATRLAVRWSPDGTALDFIENAAAGGKIWRQPLDEKQPPLIIVDLPKAFLHNFAWSSDGKRLVISRGQQSNDAILLTGFQL